VRSRGDAIAIFIARQYMLKIPDALLEAARIDGAGELTMSSARSCRGSRARG
jgi:ABC-type glycerol-3-phosphate transport system permease component